MREHRLLWFLYDGFERVVEPHVLGTKAGHQRILAYQVRGGSRSGGVPDWRYFDLDRVRSLKLLADGFAGPRDRDRPSSAFDQVLFTLPPSAVGQNRRQLPSAQPPARPAIPERPTRVREPRYRAYGAPSPAAQAAATAPLPAFPVRESPVLLPTVLEPVRAATAPHLRERATNLREDIAAVVHNHVARNTLTSGMFIRDAFKVCAKEIDYRVEYIWARVAQGLTHARVAVTDTLLEDIRAEIGEYRAPTLSEMLATLDGEERRSGFSSHGDLAAEWDHAVERVLGEASMEILRMANQDKPPTPLNVTFNAPGGVFQHGDHNVVHQEWEVRDVELIRTLLDRLEEQIPVVEMEPLHREETAAIVQDTRTELTKRRPHWAGALQGLTAIRQGIESVRELRPLYEQIGAFLRAHGLQFPG
jgi:hypothetical protein